MKRNVPAPSEAVHMVGTFFQRRSLCGQSMRGEREMPAGTQVTCPECARRAARRGLES